MEQNRSTTARAGLYAVGSIVSEELRWIFREQPVEDYGIDAHIEICEEGKPTGRLLAAQIKSGKSWFERRTEEGFVYTGSLRHLDYWTSYSVPVILILYHPEEKRAYWAPVESRRILRNSRGWNMAVPFSSVLDRFAGEALRELAVPHRRKWKNFRGMLTDFPRDQISSFGEDRILNFLSLAENSLDIAVPFLDEAFLWILKSLSFRVSIRLLTGSGSGRAVTEECLGKNGMEMRVLPALHEKAVILDRTYTAYGSACLTKTAWRDARELLFPDDDPQIAALRLRQFERAWDIAAP